MTADGHARPTARAPFTIPLAAGPVAPWLDRAVSGFVVVLAIACTALLAITDPDPRGYDTHTQLGMAACGWPTAHGMPCPTCGCTTAASLVVHGSPVRAFVVQPFGALCAIAGLVLGAHALGCLLRGRSFVDLLVRLRLPRWIAFAALAMGLSWYYKCRTFAP